MFIEITTGETKCLLNVNMIIEVERLGGENKNNTRITYTTGSEVEYYDVRETYEYIHIHLPKARKTNRFNDTFTAGEAERIERERYGKIEEAEPRFKQEYLGSFVHPKPTDYPGDPCRFSKPTEDPFEGRNKR